MSTTALERHSMDHRPAAVTRHRARGVSRAAILLGVGTIAALLLVVPGMVGGYDGQSMLQVTASIVERGDVTVHDHTTGVPGLHGRLYSKFGPGQSLAAIPLYLFGRALAALVAGYFRPELPAMAASLLPALATALAAAIFVLAAVELGATAGGALALGLVYVVATPAAVYTTQWFSEPLEACAVLAAVYLLVRDRTDPTAWRPLLAGMALACAVATRLEALLFAPPLVLYAWLCARRAARAALVLLPLGVALAGLGLYDLARFGSPFVTGYGQTNEAYALQDLHPSRSLGALVDALYGLLISPGKGLLEYAPAVALAPFGAAMLWARRRPETVLLLTLILTDLVAHANLLIRWVGGWSWGPRFLMPVLPLILMLIAPLLGPRQRPRRVVRYILMALAALGALVQAPALLLYEPHTYIATLQQRYHTGSSMAAMTRLEWDYIHRPDLSPIIGSWRVLDLVASRASASRASPPSVAYGGVTVLPHTWWRLLALQGVPVWPIAAVCVLLAVVAVVCGWGAFRLVSAESLDA